MSDWRFGRNWMPWMAPIYGYNGLQSPRSPYDQDGVWIMRDGWAEPSWVNPRRLDPMMNVADLYWTTEPPISTTPADR